MEGEQGELLSLLEFYERTVPGIVTTLLKKCARDVEHLRSRMLSNEQKVFAYRNATTNKPPKKILPRQANITDQIFSMRQLTAQEVSPAVSQHIGLLIQHIHGHIDVFAQAVLAYSTHKSFNFLIDSVVPSIFGNFTSVECIEVATIFYTHIIGSAQPKLASRILSPFFCSLATFKFTEAVMTHFTVLFGAKLGSSEEGTHNDNEVIAGTVQIVLESLPLLPTQHATLIQVMRTMNWSRNEIRLMLVNNFMLPLATEWINSSPFGSHTHHLKDVLCEAFSERYFGSILDEINSLRATSDVPSLYRDFGDQYILYVVTAADIFVAMKVLKLYGGFPSALDSDGYQKFPRDKFNTPFTVRVFPPALKRIRAPPEPIVFEHRDIQYDSTDADKEREFRFVDNMNTKSCSVYSALKQDIFKSIAKDQAFKDFALKKSVSLLSQQADKFEKLIRNLLSLRILEEWCHLSDAHVTMSMMKVATTTNILLPDIPALHRYRYLGRFESVIAAKIKANKVDLKKMEDSWYEFLSVQSALDIDKPTTLNSLSPARNRAFWRGVEELKCLPNCSLHRQFDMLNSILKKVAIINPDMKILLSMAIRADSKIFIRCFLVLSSLLVKSVKFSYDYLDRVTADLEVKTWTMMECALLEAFSADLRLLYVHIQEQLME